MGCSHEESRKSTLARRIKGSHRSPNGESATKDHETTGRARHNVAAVGLVDGCASRHHPFRVMSEVVHEGGLLAHLLDAADDPMAGHESRRARVAREKI